MKSCTYCGVSFAPRNARQKLCGSRECRLLYMRDDQAARNRRYLVETGARYEDQYKVERRCVDCGEVFRTKHDAERCRPCQRLGWSMVGVIARASQRLAASALRKQVVLAGPLRRAETLRFRLATERLATAAAGSRSRRAVWVGVTCYRCGTSFVCLRTGDLPQYCSRSCQRLDAKVSRRVRERGGRVRYSRYAVFERDRWTCQLCGKRVKRKAKMPDPRSAVIDHIVPLAAGPDAGGVDAPWNVQCAHFLCNSIKRDQCTAPALF